MSKVYTCEKCAKKICDGDYALVYNGHKVCEECIEDMSGRDVLWVLGIPIRKVELEELLDI